jgi:hypothetical protein
MDGRLPDLHEQAAVHACEGAPDHASGARAPDRGGAGATRLDENPDLMRVPRGTVEHPFSTIKAEMGETHFPTKQLPPFVGRTGAGHCA